MQKNIPKSRLLRSRLLIALITCLLAVMLICTAIFQVMYRQTVRNVNVHSQDLAADTLNAVSDAYYQMNLSELQTMLHLFGRETAKELGSTSYPDMGESDVFRQYLRSSAQLFFTDTNHSSATFFLLTADGVQSVSLNSLEGRSAETQEVLAAFDDMRKAGDPVLSQYPSFFDFLASTRFDPDGCYTKEGSGYIIAWDNMRNYSEYTLCYGIYITDANRWLVSPVEEVTSKETDTLNSKLDLLFRKYIYIMLASVGGVLLVFILISVILSKKLADPVVSEHDMLVELNEMKTTFLSDASHELKTPLAAMSGYAQNAQLDLMQGGDPAAIQEKLKRISSEANRMALMVTQILDATRIEEGRLILERSPCDLDSLVRETVETYFAVLNKNNNRLSLRIPLDLPKVSADSSRLQRVFVNLISNALRHTRNGMILIKAEPDGAFVKVTVKDTGCGISAEDMPHIWERYYKGKHSETGTGLGLFICKFVIGSHGGTIRAESEPGKGTAFIFTLPVADEASI